MPSPLSVDGHSAKDIHEHIRRLTDNLVKIKDKNGYFLLKLEDGRIIDTKGWNDWEWTHGIGLYGLFQYYSLTSSQVGGTGTMSSCI